MGDAEKFKFSVVHFKSDDAVETVPFGWIFEENKVTYCRFPPNKRNIRKLLSNPDSKPSIDWEAHELVKVVKSYKTQQRAENRAKHYVVNSDEDSTEVEGRGRKRQKRQDAVFVEAACPSSGLEQLIHYAPHNGTVTLPLLNPNLLNTEYDVIDSNITQNAEPPVRQNKLVTDAIQSPTRIAGTTLEVELGSQAFRGDPESLSLSSLQDEMRKFQEETILKLVTLESGNNKIKLLLLKLLANQRIGETVSDSSSYPLLPLTSIADFDAIENWLNDTKNIDKLVSALSKIGGQRISSSVYNVLSHVINATFAKDIRLTAASGKLAFGPTKLANVVRESVRISSIEPVSNIVIDQYIGRWFRNSNDRKGGRRLRKGRKNANTTDNEEAETTPKLTLLTP